MNVLVTGGAGFIGSHIVDLLIEADHRVWVVDDLSTGRRENVHAAAAFEELDIATAGLARVFEQARPFAVVHQAAQPSVPRSIQEPLLDARTNIVGTVNLLECCRRFGVQRIVFASSAAVYGKPEQIPLTEGAATRPLSPYGVAKLAAERYLSLFHELFGLEAIVLRYANVYGPRQDAHGEAGVVSIFVNQVLTGDQPVIHGDGGQTRDFVYVADIARANLAALQPEAKSGIYNVGSGTGTSISKLFELVATGRVRPRHGPTRPGDIRHSVLDPSVIEQAFGWRVETRLAEGLAATMTYFSGQIG
jgi:UDP-glucose 4-epimerase